MDVKIKGGQILRGEIYPSGMKNSAVALIPASILFDEPIVLENVPEISDVERLLKILINMGSRVNWDREAKILEIDNKNIKFTRLGKEDLGNMRGTSLFWGPMLVRFRKVIFDELPGGCTLGFRTLDPHYQAFRDLGVRVKQTYRSVAMDASRARANEIWLSELSPTATENALLLAVGLSGETKIIGASSELQVQDLCNFLISAGAKIKGVGSNILVVEGGHRLRGVRHKILSDHLEVATFLAIGAATGGEVVVHDSLPEFFKPIANVFLRFGVDIKYDGEKAKVSREKIVIDTGERGILTVKAQPWPALPVDILPLFIPLALAAKEGQVLFHNWMYESGLFWTSELTKLGANIIIADPHRVVVIAGRRLRGATLEAPYIIRATVAMVMAAMIAEGESIILNADTLYRGHPHFSENLRNLGAEIEEIQ